MQTARTLVLTAIIIELVVTVIAAALPFLILAGQSAEFTGLLALVVGSFVVAVVPGLALRVLAAVSALRATKHEASALPSTTAETRRPIAARLKRARLIGLGGAALVLVGAIVYVVIWRLAAPTPVDGAARGIVTTYPVLFTIFAVLLELFMAFFAAVAATLAIRAERTALELAAARHPIRAGAGNVHI